MGRYSRIDVLVNNAGVGKFVGMDFALEEFDVHFHTNLRAPMLMVKHCLQMLRASEAPCVINMSSIAARLEWGNHFLYSCAKNQLGEIHQTPGARSSLVESKLYFARSD